MRAQTLQIIFSTTIPIQIKGSQEYHQAPVAYGSSRGHPLKTDDYIRRYRDHYARSQPEDKKAIKKDYGVSVPCSFHDVAFFDLDRDVVMCSMHWAANVFKLGTELLSGKKLKKAKTMQNISKPQV